MARTGMTPKMILAMLTAVVAWPQTLHAQQASVSAQPFTTPQQLVLAMLRQENLAHRELYEFTSTERSERTGGHLWTERVVEVSAGRIRLLLAEDGKPLSADRAAAEHARLANIAVDPSVFTAEAAALKKEEGKDREMLTLLPKAFILENVKREGDTWHIDFRPDPNYSTSGLEERVLHGMSGWLAIDANDLALVHIEAHLPADVSIGFGFLATIKAGSHFLSDRQKIAGHWRTVHVLTDIRGKAALFKAVAKNSEVTRSDFHYLQADMDVSAAAKLLETATPQK